MEQITRQIDNAFCVREYPGDNNVTHCTYDKANGGNHDGPCGECVAIADFFCGKLWRDISAKELRIHGQADILFTVEAYCYYLPAYLIAAVRDCEELDVCANHLTYRFGPKAEDGLGQDRLSKMFAALSGVELQVILEVFKHAYDLEDDFDGYLERSILNVERALQSPNKSLHPTAASGGG
jgi:hypothetical protein